MRESGVIKRGGILVVFLNSPDKRLLTCLADLPLYLAGMQFNVKAQ